MQALNKKGFTLIEVLVVISIISILFLVLVPQINGFFVKSNESGLRTDFKAFQLSSESFFRETLGNHLETEELNKFLDATHSITDDGNQMHTKSVDPWQHPYEVEFGVRKVAFTSYGEKEHTSIKKYGMVTYIYNGVVDSCTYGFATGNILLSKIKNLPSDFVCGSELSTTLPVQSGVLNAPNHFRTLYVEETMAMLTWDQVPGATNYVLKRNGVPIYSGTGTTYSDITLARGVTYTYTLAAKDTSRTSAYAKLSVTTTLSPPPLTGKGTVADPYLIYSVYQLQNIQKNTSAHYALGTNIDASVTKNWNEGNGFIPIGSFFGSLDGRGHSIVDLRIHSAVDKTGLFSYLTQFARIQDVYVLDADVSGTSDVGIIAGFSLAAHIENVHTTGIVTATGGSVGGIVGSSSAILTNVSVKAEINGSTAVGGVLGTNGTAGSLSQASFEGKVQGLRNVGGVVGFGAGDLNQVRSVAVITGESSVGGIAGVIFKGINEAFADVTVTATGNYVGGIAGFDANSIDTISIRNVTVQGKIKGLDWAGGIVGRNSSTVQSAVSKATVNGRDYVGGIAGSNAYQTVQNSNSSGDISGKKYVGGLFGEDFNIEDPYDHTNVYATGSITGTNNVGGLIGESYKVNLTNAYATGNVTGTKFVGGIIGHASDFNLTNIYATGKITANTNKGGIIGLTYTPFISTSTYYDKNTTGMNDTGRGIGKTTEEMKNPATYIGWDFTGTWEMNASKNNGYPTLRSSP